MTLSLRQYLKARIRVLLVGPPGCAKTARLIADGIAEGFTPFVMRASLCERIDFGGALVPDFKAGVTKMLPLEALLYLKTTKDKVLLILDDLGQAPTDVQAALMRLFDAGELGENVLIAGATNRPGDRAGVTALCEPLRSRFALAFRIATPSDGNSDDPNGGVPMGTWAQEVENWNDWALDHGAPPEVVAWHRSTQGRTLYQWKPHADPSVRMPDFRSWETVITLWNAGMRDLASLGAAISRPVAAEFLAFARLADKLPTPEQVFMDPDGAPVPTDPSALYLVAAFLGAAAEQKHARALVKYLTRMPRVFGALLARDAHKRLGAKLSGTREWADWWKANSAIFEVGATAAA